MKHLTPSIIAEITGGKYLGDERSGDVMITGAVRDNREVKPGNLFICIRGARADGHSFANNAFSSGAACCLAEQIIPNAEGPYVLVDSTLDAIKMIGKYYRKLFDIPVIGITGSVGKTTTKELVAAVLGAKYNVLKTEMNLNNELGVPLTLLSINETHEAAVIEMGISDFGEMGRLAEMVNPDIFIITKIGYAHLLELGDLHGVLRAKTEAFAYMDEDGIALLNGDDELLRNFDPGIKKYLFGHGSHNDYRIENIRVFDTESTNFDLINGTDRFPAVLSAYGSHLSSLAPAAAAAGKLLGLTNDEIIRGFSSFKTVEGRARVIKSNTLTLIDDCYNANPNSVKAALVSLSTLPGRRVAILGDMINLGDTSEQLHYETGEAAAQYGIELLICHGEKALHIHNGFTEKGGKESYHYPDRNEFIDAVLKSMKKSDTVLVKASHGMHFEELIPFISDGGFD